MFESILERVAELDTHWLLLLAFFLPFGETVALLDAVVPGELGLVVVGAAARLAGVPLFVVQLRRFIHPQAPAIGPPSVWLREIDHACAIRRRRRTTTATSTFQSGNGNGHLNGNGNEQSPGGPRCSAHRRFTAM